MSNPVELDTALLTEHFGYRPATLIDDIINSINTRAFEAISSVEKAFENAQPETLGWKIPSSDTPEGQAEANAVREKFKYEIENGVHQLETLLETKIDHNFDKMEVFMLRNYLSIPQDVRGWIRMHHYEGLDLTPKSDAPTIDSITKQRQRLRETQKLHTLLQSESERNAATIASLQAILTPSSQPLPKVEQSESEPNPESQYPALAFLKNKGDLSGDHTHPLGTTTSFAISQLQALKALLDQLGPRLQTLKDKDGKQGYVGEAEKSWRRERLEFVETETRKHLEQVRGLELGKMGEVRDGEWQGEGRKLQRGEVEDLEKVVKMVRGSELEKPPAENGV
ncbi:putative MTW1 [Coleophoma crateriformis]|uniref:Putative MTW1 n=1 Tax=Coleophoma crateriformis TaxID=565419 RepID=A0A3D8SAP6_9HELO|nr:putative MTW1 [Coleophoma crateriformis]